MGISEYRRRGYAMGHEGMRRSGFWWRGRPMPAVGEAEARELIESYIRERGVTVCPPRHAVRQGPTAGRHLRDWSGGKDE